MRHGKRNQRLSRPSEHKESMVQNLVRSLIQHGQLETTLARAREAQRMADRLVTLGKAGSLHARRQAFRLIQDRTLVGRLFTEIAPRFVDVSGGYTRVVRVSIRRGDGAQQAVLAFSRLPAVAPAPAAPTAKAAQKPTAPSAASETAKETPEESEKSKGFFEGLRGLWPRKKK